MVSMQYGTGALILLALEDVLAGPERMHRDMTFRGKEIREIRSRYPDGQNGQELTDFPGPRTKKPPRKGRAVIAPSGPMGKIKAGAAGLVRQFRPVRALAHEHPEALVPHVDLRWWRLAQMDSAVVSSADGTTASWYQRDPKEFSRQMARSAQLHARLYQEWPELARRYREASRELTSPDVWKLTFEGLSDTD
jgi:galactofuranosylgalactofuranosylrhamnosyl-N-acetylglucosaminyl-diphospho-decaprenol beta-1,5/1,6-galactofuranosyltransferase